MIATLRKPPLLVLAALLPALVLSGSAHALGGNNENPDNNNADGQDLSTSVSQSRIRLTYEGGEPDGRTGNLTSIDPNWEPPACWYEPVLSPRQLAAGVKRLQRDGGMGAVNAHEFWTDGIFVDHYAEEEPWPNWDGSAAPGYRNYNLDKQGDGMFWRSVVREGLEEDQRAWDCGRIMFWEDAGEIPDDPQAPDSETLAAYAYDHVRVPDTEVEMAPGGRQTVNLATWMWLDKATFKDVKVRAELPDTGLWAETTAKPVRLKLAPGTPEATLHPASGECEFNDDGSIGTPYRRGDSGKTPPCGVTYEKATTNKPPFKLKASVVWEITWAGNDGSGDFPDGEFGTEIEVPVREVQTVVRPDN